MTREEKLVDIIRIGVRMRDAQKAYFTKGRTQVQLAQSKALEREFDQAAKEVDSPGLI